MSACKYGLHKEHARHRRSKRTARNIQNIYNYYYTYYINSNVVLVFLIGVCMKKT